MYSEGGKADDDGMPLLSNTASNADGEEDIAYAGSSRMSDEPGEGVRGPEPSEDTEKAS
jgi:hypothetical protein